MKTLTLLMLLTFVISVNAREALIPGYEDNIGVRLFKQFKYQEAERYFQSITDTDTKLIELTHVYLAKLNFLRGKGSVAVEHAKHALEINPNGAAELTVAAEAYCAAAMQVSIFKALSYGKKCGKFYTKAAETSPVNIVALKTAIQFHIEAPSMAGGSMKTAKRFLQQLKTLSPEDALLIELFYIEEKESTEAAIKRALNYVEYEFQKDENLYALAMFFNDRDKYSEAELLLNNLMDRPASDNEGYFRQEALFHLGLWLIERHNALTEGCKRLDKYLSLNKDTLHPNFFWARWHLANAYKAQGKPEKHNALITEIKQHNYEFNQEFQTLFDSQSY